MPLLNYTSSNFPFTPFTKIYSADLVQCFNDVKTLLNTTGLDDTNLQALGISLSKLKQSSASSGQFVSWNGSAWVAASNPLSSQYNIILGSASQVTSGLATHSTFASVSQANGDRILILPAYSATENWSITKKLLVVGLGATSVITGTVTFTATSDESQLLNIKVTDNITLDSGADAIHINNIILASGKTFTDNGSGNLLEGIQE